MSSILRKMMYRIRLNATVRKLRSSSLKRKVGERSRSKVFCIGMNKTGTTSIRKEFQRMGLIVGIEREAEMLYKEFFSEDYEPIYDYIDTGEAFQDFPFSYPGFFRLLDQRYPDAKFILTVRSSSDQWFDSLVRFHSKVFGSGRLPDETTLRESIYVEKGMAWVSFSNLFKVEPGEELYNKERLVEVYEDHNRAIREYFKDKPGRLLELDLSEEGAYQEFCAFLDYQSEHSTFPWENKTD